jgi:site-specific DNA-cytosine methylase
MTEHCSPDNGPPLAIDLFCGVGGWTEGLLAEGYYVVGFDIEQHVYGEHRYPAQLVVQDVLTLHGSQFKNAALIVASPPCQEYSYMAMPWSLAKAKAAAIRADKSGADLERLNRLFNACFRIQREACDAAGRHIPLIVENVRGAQEWVGRARWNYGSFYLWGDVPALMPVTFKGVKVPSFRFDGSGKSFQTASVRRTNPGNGARFTSRDCGVEVGIKQGGDWFNASQPSISRLYGSKSPQRKMASAMIAKIPFPLSRYIAATFKPAPLMLEAAE